MMSQKYLLLIQEMIGYFSVGLVVVGSFGSLDVRLQSGIGAELIPRIAA